MDKYQFLSQLREKLRSIPEADASASLSYYREMIDDRMEEGLTEEEAVAAVGDVDQIARSILAETPPIPPAPEKKKRRLHWWEITLLILGFPVWFSLLAAVAAVLFSLWISLWSVVISLYATAFALGVSAIGCILGSFFMIGGTWIVAWGAALICAGLAIVLFLLSNLAAKGLIALTRLTWKGLKALFAGKEEKV